MMIDMVCKMKIDEKGTRYSLTFESETYFFCSEGCLAEFKRHSDDYLKPPGSCCDEPKEETLDV